MAATHMRQARPRRARRCLAVLSAIRPEGLVRWLSFVQPVRRPRRETRPRRRAPNPPPGAPWKFTFRQAPYLFFSDFELDQKNAVFRELAGLRDQVYKELQLPPGTAAVQVYLFEDRDHYQTFMDLRHPRSAWGKAGHSSSARRSMASSALTTCTSTRSGATASSRIYATS